MPTTDKRKNIIIFSQTIQPGGAERQAIYLAKALQNEHQVFFVTFYSPNANAASNLSVLNSLNLQSIELKGNILNKVAALFKLIKEEKIEIIFSYLLLPNFLGGILGRLAGVKYPIGGIRSSKLTKPKIWINRILQNHINKFTIYNNWSGFHEFPEMGFRASRAILIQNCIEIKNEVIKRDACDEIKILSVGRFAAPKDYYTALLSVKSVYYIFKNIKYYIIGYGSLLPQIKLWIIELQLEECVEVIINPPNLGDYYKKSDIFLMTSIFEGLSNSVLEAMSYSLPLVLTDAGDNKKLLEYGNGYLCKIKDYEDIANKLLILIQNHELRSTFGLKSFEAVHKYFSFESFQLKYLTFINTLK